MLTIAVTSRTLFDLEAEHQIYQQHGSDAFNHYQRENENTILNPGSAFGLVSKLLKLNTPGKPRDRVEIVLLSRNSAEAGLRVLNSIHAHNLDIDTAVFTSGGNRFKYYPAAAVHLFLSANEDEVKMALESGVAAATLMPNTFRATECTGQVKIAFDGDAVLFSDESERVYRAKGLAAFVAHELENVDVTLPDGPIKPFLIELHNLQKMLKDVVPPPISIALVTARGSLQGKRVFHTFRKWGMDLDTIILTGGKSKAGFLLAYGADIFFDDTKHHIEQASAHVPSAHVPSGIANES